MLVTITIGSRFHREHFSSKRPSGSAHSRRPGASRHPPAALSFPTRSLATLLMVWKDGGRECWVVDDDDDDDDAIFRPYRLFAQRVGLFAKTTRRRRRRRRLSLSLSLSYSRRQSKRKSLLARFLKQQQQQQQQKEENE